MKVYDDGASGNIIQGYDDLQTLFQTMIKEYQFTVDEKLPSSEALVGYTTIDNDVQVITDYKEICFVFLVYVAGKLAQPTNNPPPASMTSGLPGSGSSSGVPSLGNYSSGDLGTAYSSIENLNLQCTLDDQYDSIFQASQVYNNYEGIIEANEPGSQDFDPFIYQTVNTIDDSGSSDSPDG